MIVKDVLIGLRTLVADDSNGLEMTHLSIIEKKLKQKAPPLEEIHLEDRQTRILVYVAALSLFVLGDFSFRLFEYFM